MNLVWFRGDLRVDDNRALSAACQHSDQPLVAVFFYCDQQWTHYGIGGNQRHLLNLAIESLTKSLAEFNIPLLVLKADEYSEVPAYLSTFCAENHVKQIFFNVEYPQDERLRDKQATELLQNQGIEVSRFNDQTLVEPWSMTNQQGAGFKVYTPFSKLALNKLNESSDLWQTSMPLKPLSKENFQRKISLSPNLERLPTKHLPKKSPTASSQPDISEKNVHRQLLDFTETSIKNYHEDRDFPSIKGTSELSTALALGTLSIRRCYQAALAVSHETSGEGTAVWIKELLWRDFYRSIMWHFPHVCRNEAFLPVDKQIVWNDNTNQLTAWQTGETGIPIVDAAMKQLLATGWMHNRLRMIVASFLCKNLWMDWRIGERFFATHLYDYDFASNNGGWQWSASVGTDAAPYFRVFNPASQGSRFDPNAEFIRKWIPELSNYSAKQIHNFERMKFDHYLAPIVDLKVTRKASIELFKVAKQK